MMCLSCLMMLDVGFLCEGLKDGSSTRMWLSCSPLPRPVSITAPEFNIAPVSDTRIDLKRQYLHFFMKNCRSLHPAEACARAWLYIEGVNLTKKNTFLSGVGFLFFVILPLFVRDCFSSVVELLWLCMTMCLITQTATYVERGRG